MAGHPAIFYYLCTRFQKIMLFLRVKGSEKKFRSSDICFL